LTPELPRQSILSNGFQRKSYQERRSATPQTLFGNIGPVVAHSVSESSWRMIPASRLGSLNHVVLANLSAGKARAGRIVSKRRDKALQIPAMQGLGQGQEPK
jgi:hypothetical protein